ncbi:MAG: J domain-containing protein [Gammaproteobacteria bacterium]|nr:J domain-containing protein [Gammaproteobacteria bacterium]
MSKLSIENAFKLLELPLDASENLIKKTYHKKSRIYHPDMTNGDDKLQAKINDAYEIALAFAKIRTSLVLIDSSSLQRFDRSVDAQRALVTANQSSDFIKKERTRTLQFRKYILITVTAISAILALFGQNFIPLITSENTQVDKIVKIISAFITITLGSIVVWFQWQISLIQNKIDTYLHDLSDQKKCAKELSKIVNYQDLDIITENQILSDQNNEGSFKSDLNSLLLLKSQEHGILEIINPSDISPDSITKYKLKFKPRKFKPSLFKKPLPTEAKSFETKERTKGDILGMLFFGLIILIGFSVATIYLIIVKSSKWSILTGIFGLSGLTGIIDSLSELRSMRKKTQKESK